MRIARQILFTLAVTAITGCGHSPMLDIGGSFFPAWLLCLAAGVAVAMVVQIFCSRRGLSTQLGAPILFFPSLALACACLLWLVLFR
jgi:hypothetical protein